MYEKAFLLLILIRGFVRCNITQLSINDTLQSTINISSTTPYNWVPDGYRQGLMGGFPSHISKFPFLASVEVKDKVVCCASILRPTWLLTSVNCIFLYRAEDLVIRAGSEFAEVGGQELTVARIFRHPDNDGSWKADVALIQVTQDILLGRVAQTVQISKDLPMVNGSLCRVCGWGYASERAQKLTVVEDFYPLLDLPTCMSRFIKADRRGLSEKNFCTCKRGHVPCYRDEGNPLIYDNMVIGVYSGTENCYEAKHPAIFQDFRHYYDWIQETLENNTLT